MECGFTQGELAAQAGVSRQLVAAVEAGRNAPAVEAALGIARALGTTVEALFAGPPGKVVGALDDTLPDGTLLRIGQVGDQLVASRVSDHGVAGASWAKADGVIDAGELRLFERASPASAVLAGCDPALGLAETMLAGLGPRSLLAISAPTDTALSALKLGRLHAAVVHGVDNRLPDPPVAVVRLHFARWQVGLAVPANRQRDSLEALLNGELPVVQRDSGAASQQALERAATSAGIEQVPSGHRASGHLDAARGAAMLNGVGVTTEAAARAFDLSFVALEDHVVEVWIAERWAAHPGVQALGELLATAAFTERVAQFGGYDLAGCGGSVDP